MAGWDFVVLTASNEEQAKGYRLEMNHRKKGNRLPADCVYAALPDPEGKRVGSGGATFHVLRYLMEQTGATMDGFRGKKILVIHSGGDSKRVPQYSVCGKLFSPVPRQLPDGNWSTLFDELMLSMEIVSERIKEGMLVLSGDVLLIFDANNLDFSFRDAAALSIKEPVSTGMEHGVFLRGKSGMVERFLHKYPEEGLREAGAVDGQGCVDLDTGAVLFSCNILEALLGLICTDGRIDGKKYDAFVNEKARISFYGDFLYPLGAASDLEEFYKQIPEGSDCRELRECREKIWKALFAFDMSVISLSPAKFIHFGTTKELLSLVTRELDDYAFLGFKKVAGANRDDADFAIRNSFLAPTAVAFQGCYLENSDLGEDVVVEEGAILSCAALKKITIPAHTVMHIVKQKDGRFAARLYGVTDNPKGTYKENTPFLLSGLKEMLDDYNIPPEEVWEEKEADSLWEAKLYPLAESAQKAAEDSLLLYQMAGRKADADEVKCWLKKERTSLYLSFNRADMEEVIPFREKLRRKILVGKAAGSDHSTAMRIYASLGMEEECFAVIKRQIEEGMKGSCIMDPEIKICKEEAKIALPLRVNWGGGWTDTPPYCNEHGGMVLNAAIKLNGILPVRAVVRRLDELHIEFESTDLGVSTVIGSLDEIQNCKDPYDLFALHKAALIACGLIPEKDLLLQKDITLEDILRRLGGGIYLATKVESVPKGSGLGTSSILAGACVKAIADFTGVMMDEGVLFDRVLYMEQLMSTGGGWQDQAGGIIPGIKMITSNPGARQILQVEPVFLDDRTKEELNSRFAVIYTGQRRLARNLLREVVGNYIRGRKESIAALEGMKAIAVLMKKSLEKGEVDAFAALLNRHWELSLQLDAGATNPDIDRIFVSLEDLVDGKFIAGAGGGGFLQIIMKKGVTPQQVNERLKASFPETGAALWESELYFG